MLKIPYSCFLTNEKFAHGIRKLRTWPGFLKANPHQAMRFAKIIKDLDAASKAAFEKWQKTLLEYCELDESGQLKTDASEGREAYKVREDKEEEFRAKEKEFVSQVLDIDAKGVSVSALADSGLTPEELAELSSLLEN